MKYEIPYFCPIQSLHFCLSVFLCPCIVSSIIYSKLFTTKPFSLFAFIFIPFAAYGIRRYVVEKLNYNESYEISAMKACCFCNSLTQDLNEMKTRKIGVFRFNSEDEIIL
ncbi:hypothetical protein TUBRATIS_12740 [Tubulinosema ratisbonensis]|uniref:Uncharacterized protein n=1 Tax=Tubulinosema ratisbonensis TaxID=291195 RepID=A0A437AMC0_9MICR|nr:hypothetical protein TUBRATIS_12740 [Tubulinosema ratisbonensis]